MVTELEAKEVPETHSEIQWLIDENSTYFPMDIEIETTIPENTVIANLSQGEYIRGDLFKGIETEKGGVHPGLNLALAARIMWSSDPSLAFRPPCPRLWNFGTWAGSRLAIGDLGDYKGEISFKDITDIVFYEVYALWKLHYRCEVPHYEEREKFDLYREPDPLPPSFSLRETIATETVSFASSMNQPRYFSVDVLGYIFVYLDTPSLLSCALASRAFAYEANRALYRTVCLSTVGYTQAFNGTLGRDPVKKYYMRHLELQLEMNPKSRQLAHNILTELPNLERLKFHSCWLSYEVTDGFQQYPFKLRSLSWGLIPNMALLLFLRSQPSIETLEFSPEYEPLSDWFRFWPDLLPNLRNVEAEDWMIAALCNLEVVKKGQCPLKSRLEYVSQYAKVYPWLAEE
ncbi:hypothetical protein FRC17_002876 [Serendipita sp. 399]|nr:hypothetical protein FRC17_002876 [Serendipita sp. 399]